MVVALLIWGEALEQGLSLSGVVTWLEAQGRFAWLANIADLTLPIPASAVGVASAGMVGYGLSRWLGRPPADTTDVKTKFPTRHDSPSH